MLIGPSGNHELGSGMEFTRPIPPEAARDIGSARTLRGIEFFSAASDEGLAELESQATFFSCAAGTLLFVEGQKPEEVFFLLRGWAKLYVNSSDDRCLTLHIAQRGEILGLTSAITGDSHRMTAEAFCPCSLVSIRNAELMRFLMANPRMFQATARELGRTYEQACKRLHTVGGTRSNVAKLASLLLELSEQGQETSIGTQISLHLRHSELGECIGTSRETVTRILRDLQERQILTLRGPVLTIVDWVALRGCADGI